MQYATWFRRAGWLVAIAIASTASQSVLADDKEAADEQAPAAKEVAGPEESAPSKKASDPAEAKPEKETAKPQGRVLVPKYRLGVAFAPVPAALDAQFDLQGEGLLVQRVGQGGPAHKAGIKRGDILLAVGDKRIKQYGDAVEGLNTSEGKASLKVLRDGKTITVPVPLTKHKGDEKVFVPKVGAAQADR